MNELSCGGSSRHCTEQRSKGEGVISNKAPQGKVGGGSGRGVHRKRKGIY